MVDMYNGLRCGKGRWERERERERGWKVKTATDHSSGLDLGW
jgi:hypothetical protein